MKAYTTDEVSFEITEFDIPRRLAATGIEFYKDLSATHGTAGMVWEPLDAAHYIGAIEGYIAGYNVGHWVGYGVGVDTHEEPDFDKEGQTGATFDDDEYPAHRRITHHDDGTLVLEARYGRNKRWVLAINREGDDKAKMWVENWILKETT